MLGVDSAPLTVECDTEVAVIGNGPAGIAVSFLLSGHWPYYASSRSCAIQYLHAKLAQKTTSILEQDLITLSEGLEGRSTSPVSLLFDALDKPNADFTTQWESAIEWRHNRNNFIDHVVIGKGPPGGTWVDMTRQLLTLSYGSWMSLPGYSFQQWSREQGAPPDYAMSERVTRGEVSDYYRDYIEKTELSNNFLNYASATSVKRISRLFRTDCKPFYRPPPALTVLRYAQAMRTCL
eukprot:Colp12_sorted_trinity150504_noHs@36463